MDFLTVQVRKQYANRVLHRMDVRGSIEGFMLVEPGQGRLDSTMILFTPEGIVLAGDLCPVDNHGVASDPRYGIEWFSKLRGERYLCEKFLSKEYRPEAARAWVEERVADLEREGDSLHEAQRDHLDFLRLVLEEDSGESEDGEYFGTINKFYNFLTEAELQDNEVDPMDYNPREAGCLCGIQDAFAREYPKLRLREMSQEAPVQP